MGFYFTGPFTKARDTRIKTCQPPFYPPLAALQLSSQITPPLSILSLPCRRITVYGLVYVRVKTIPAIFACFSRANGHGRVSTVLLPPLFARTTSCLTNTYTRTQLIHNPPYLCWANNIATAQHARVLHRLFAEMLRESNNSARRNRFPCDC